MIDSYFERSNILIANLFPDFSLSRVYKFGHSIVLQVENVGQKYVLKIAHTKTGLERLLLEQMNLEKAKNIEGVTHLLHIFTQPYAILKEYFPGTTVRENGPIQNKLIQQYLRNTLVHLHAAGVYDIELTRWNIVYNDSSARIIDLGPRAPILSDPKMMKTADFQSLEYLFV